MTCADDAYLGSDATPLGLCALAGARRAAEVATADAARPGVAHSVAPVRPLAIQAVVLYLTAFLRLVSRSGSEARRIGSRPDGPGEARKPGELALRRRTVGHSREIGCDREYLVVRCALERLRRTFHANRLVATLADVGDKVAATPPVNARGVAVPSSAAARASAS